MKFFPVKHAAGKNDRPEIRSNQIKGDIIAPSPAIPEFTTIELSIEKKTDGMVSITDHGDITKNLHALVLKYQLGGITLSTTDGLMIASTSEYGSRDAAYYGQAVNNGVIPSVPGMKLFQVTYKGSLVTGIIRSDHLVTDISLENIKNDIKMILIWWI